MLTESSWMENILKGNCLWPWFILIHSILKRCWPFWPGIRKRWSVFLFMLYRFTQVPEFPITWSSIWKSIWMGRGSCCWIFQRTGQTWKGILNQDDPLFLELDHPWALKHGQDDEKQSRDGQCHENHAPKPECRNFENLASLFTLLILILFFLPLVGQELVVR